MKAKQQNQKEGKNMNPLTHFKKTKILRNIFLSVGTIFALAINAHAQNLYVSAHTPGTGAHTHSILEFTPIWRAEHLRFKVVLPPRVGP